MAECGTEERGGGGRGKKEEGCMYVVVRPNRLTTMEAICFRKLGRGRRGKGGGENVLLHFAKKTWRSAVCEILRIFLFLLPLLRRFASP